MCYATYTNNKITYGGVTRRLGVRGVDYLMGPIQVNDDDTKEVWMAI